MLRFSFRRSLLCIAVVLACGAALGDDDGQDLLDKATDTKLAAESVADLNQVVTLCHEALKAGLDEGNTKFANGLLASTLTQRAELVCRELFERPVTPNRGRKLVQMALADLEETLKIDAEQGEAQYMIGRLYAHLGQQEKGLKALDEAVRLSEDEPQTKARALIIRANLKQDPAQRQADFDEAVKLTPRDPNVLRFRGMHYLTQNKLETAIADFDAAIALDPKDADTHEARGVALSLGQKYDEAMESFDKAIEIEPNAPASYTHRARIRAIKGDLPAALADVEMALKLQPGSVAALQLHASLLGSVGKFEQALADLNLLRRAMPDNAELLLQIATLHQAAKQPDKAIAAYDHVIETDPKVSAAFRGRADAHLSLGKQAEALADYEAALALEPKNSGVLNNLAWVLATSPEEKLRNGKRSVELAKLACDVTEYKQAHILSTLAAGYAETGDFDTAVTWSEKAVELGGDQLKDQLTQELESYREHKPWREAAPPPPDSAEEQATKPEKNAAPDNDDTARSKSGVSSVDREKAWLLVCQYTASDSLRKHMLAVEAAMRAYARRFGEDETTWGIVGLLHDFDYERWPTAPDHPLQGSAILAEHAYPHHVIYAIKSHADYLTDCPRVSPLDKTLYACDELAGFITAVAKIRPEGIRGMQAGSVKKKLKQKSFAAAVRREDIDRGAADLGVELDAHIQFVIDAMAAIAKELDLDGPTSL